jgi:hypothetical protein
MQKTTSQESTEKYLMNELLISKTKSDFILSFWIFWVESVTITSREFQQVLASASVNKWFLMELAKEEKEFKFLSADYSQLAGQGKEIDMVYIKCISKLMSRFPLPLVANAKKRELKSKSTKVEGIQIETSILNQN